MLTYNILGWQQIWSAGLVTFKFSFCCWAYWQISAEVSFFPPFHGIQQLRVIPWSFVVWCCLMLFDDMNASGLSSLSSLSSDRILFQSFMNRVWDIYKMQSQVALGCLHFPNGPVLLLAIVVFLHIYSSKYMFIFCWCWWFFLSFFFFSSCSMTLVQPFNIMPVKFMSSWFEFFLVWTSSFVDTPEKEWANELKPVKWKNSPLPYCLQSLWVRDFSNISCSCVLFLLARMKNSTKKWFIPS